MRANNALGIDDIGVRSPENGPNRMKQAIGTMTSTGGSGSDPISQPTTSGHDLPVRPGESPRRPGGPARTSSVVEAKPPAPPPQATVAKPPAPAPPTARPGNTRRPTAKQPPRGGRRA